MLQFPLGFNIDDELRKEVADMVNEMTRKNILSKHPYAITETVRKGKTCYVTYVYDETKHKNRRQISAYTLENLENKIIEAYKDENTLTFEKVAYEYMLFFKKMCKDTTFSRSMRDYNKFVLDSDIKEKDITKISRNDLKKYFQTQIKKHKLKDKAYQNCRCLINKIFAYAMDENYISVNPMIGLSVSKSDIDKPKKKTREELVFTNKERDLLREYIKHDTANYFNSAPYAILLSFQLGLRVGELIALKWTDIEKNTIHIQRQETTFDIYDAKLKKIKGSEHKIVEYTKTTAGDRILPLSPEAIKILDDVKEWNKENNLNSEYIFVNAESHYYNRQRINERLYVYCEKTGIIKKSTHKIRRSVISNLLDNMVNKVSVRDFAGHEDVQTTLKSYYNDVSYDGDLYETMCSCL